jgi:hypothetical protein
MNFTLSGIAYALGPCGRSLVKSNEPNKRVMRWNKMEIGVSHDPGDKRHRRTMKAGYGHIRGSYGDAEDGMAVDVYIGPDLASQDVFRVDQVVPETGELDEGKYIIGCWDMEEAKALYLSCMPARFFGSISKVPAKWVEQYQRKG